MSDLAPFVIATIRDKVVADLMEENKGLRNENETLKRLLHARNPQRKIELKFTGESRMLAENTFHIRQIQESYNTHSSFLGGQDQNVLQGPFTVKFEDFLKLELWIDGGCSVRFSDMQFYYTDYEYRLMLEGWSYRMGIMARVGDGDMMKLRMVIKDVSPDEHARVLCRKHPLDFVLPSVLEQTDNKLWYAIDDDLTLPYYKKIPLERLAELFGGKIAIFSLHSFTCTGKFIQSNLTVPFDNHNLQ